jgi:hypothetical protein
MFCMYMYSQQIQVSDGEADLGTRSPVALLEPSLTVIPGQRAITTKPTAASASSAGGAPKRYIYT